MAPVLSRRLLVAFLSSVGLHSQRATHSTTVEPCSRASPTASGCVSTAAESPPNRYISPLEYSPAVGREVIGRRICAYLRSVEGARLTDVSSDYIRAELPSLDGGPSMDTFDIVLAADEPVVTFRVQAGRPSTMTPFCVRRGCINGNGGQRDQVERLRSAVGLTYQDAPLEAEKRWVPIFLHGG